MKSKPFKILWNKFLRLIYLKNPQKYAETLGVKFGKDCSISSRLFPTEGYLIEIGDCVRVARGASFYTHGGIVALRKYYQDPDLDQFGKIKIGNYSSIGANSIILPGVTIGERCVIAAGAVVTKSVPDGCMVAGNPAKIIGFSDAFYKHIKENNNAFACKRMSYEEKKAYILSQPEEKFIKKGYMQLPQENAKR